MICANDVKSCLQCQRVRGMLVVAISKLLLIGGCVKLVWRHFYPFWANEKLNRVKHCSKILLKGIPFPQTCIPVSVLKSRYFCWSWRYNKTILTNVEWHLRPSGKSHTKLFHWPSVYKQMSVVKTSQELEMLSLSLLI